MTSIPHLPFVTKAMAESSQEVLRVCRVHRTEPKALGWSSLIGAYTMGEAWFWMAEDVEVGTIVPIFGMPYTKREEAFNAYLEMLKHQ